MYYELNTFKLQTLQVGTFHVLRLLLGQLTTYIILEFVHRVTQKSVFIIIVQILLLVAKFTVIIILEEI